MDSFWKKILWKQFGATIDMLENALLTCTDELWDTDSKFWYTAYHTLFYLDYYLTEEPENYMPPPPFTLSEIDPSGIMPDRVYSKNELLIYLKFCREKCHSLIEALTDQRASKRWINEFKNYSVLEILLYSMRHTQHHVGQLNLLLRQGINDAPRWVSQTKISL